MKLKIFYLIMTLLLISFLPVTAQEAASLITIKTDKKSYVEGETIVISGEVSTVIAGTPILLQIFHQGSMISAAQFDVAEDGTFTHTINAEGDYWDKDGEYIIRAHYGEDTSEKILDFSIKKDKPETTNIFEVDAGSKGTFDVEYTIRGGTIQNIVVDQDIFGLRAMINSTEDGTMTINLPRDSIDAKTMDGEDEKFIILIDELEVVPKEVKEDNSRILTITFEEGDKEIKIIGTRVIPEFGTVMTLVLFMGITVTIIITKNKINMRI